MEKLVALLVRPPRMSYDIEKLFGGLDGEFRLRRSRLIPSNWFNNSHGRVTEFRSRSGEFEDDSIKYFRKDFTLLNERKIAFEVSSDNYHLINT